MRNCRSLSRYLAVAAAGLILQAGSLSAVILVDEDFSSSLVDFSVVSGGTWSVSSGRYILSNHASSTTPGILGNISVHNTTVSGDFTVSAVLNVVGTSNTWNDSALIFCYQNSSNYYYVSLNESNDGATRGILKVTNGSVTELADISSSFASDTDYHVEVIRSGSSITVKVDSVQVASASDSAFTSGKVGFGTYNDSARFDDLVVEAADTQAPSTPTGLSASNVTSTTVDLDWNASTDNVGVTGYKIYINGANPLPVSTNSATVTQLSPSTQFTFTVSAVDAASNESSQSSGASVTTSGSGGGGSGGGPYTITGSTDDRDVRSTGAMGWVGEPSVRVGGASSSYDSVMVYVFELPSIASGATVTSASLSFEYTGLSNNPSGKVDLYGLPYDSSGAVSSSHYYQGVYGSDSSATAIQNDILTTSTSTGTISTDSTGSSNLVDYLNAQYANGAEGGDFIYLRLNPDVSNETNYHYFNVATANSSTPPVLEFAVGTGSGGGGSAIISEDFSSGATAFDVETGGLWSVSGGRYVLTNPTSGSAAGLLGNISVHETSLAGDYVVSAVLNATGTSSTWNDVALVFGYQNDDNYYYLSLNESNDSNTMGIIRVLNGSPTELADISLSISSDTDYQVEVQRIGSSIVAKVGGTQVASTVDSSLSGGRVGFGTYNDSAEFDNLVVTGQVDTQSPSVPTGLTSSNVTDSTVDLDWNASTDNVGVAGYNVYINGSNPLSVDATSVTVEQLTPQTNYTFTVSAFDAALNESNQSTGVNVITQQQLSPVATPTFSPSGGSYSSSQNVTISTATSGATIRYTTDGSTPTTSHGAVYSSPVSITSSTTVKAIAYKSGMANSSVATASYTISTGAPLYGARGAWPSLTPASNASPTATLNSVSDLVTALRTANSGDVFHLNSMTIGNTTLNDATAKANLASIQTNVLVRPAPGATVTITGTLISHLPRITWAYFKLEGTISLRADSTRSRLARIQMGDDAGFTLEANYLELVECLKPGRGNGGDVMQIKSTYVQPGNPQNPAPRDILFDSCWFEGNDADPGDHADTLQWLCSTGYMKFRNTYIGPAGNNATLQCGTEWQRQDEQYAVFDMDTVFLGGAIVYGNGNVFGVPQTPAIYRRVEWTQVKTRSEQALPDVVEDCRFAPADPKLVNGTSISSIFPNNEFGVTVTFPTFVEPSWWD